MLGGFAIAALTIAGVGVFGVLSYSVAQRSHEIGIRTALGAQTHDIVTLVLKHALTIALGEFNSTQRDSSVGGNCAASVPRVRNCCSGVDSSASCLGADLVGFTLSPNHAGREVVKSETN